jgi:hypothetical protein
MCLPLECWQPLVEKLLVRALNAILSFMPYLLSTLVYLIPLIELYRSIQISALGKLTPRSQEDKA